jgi:hypothetical protein
MTNENNNEHKGESKRQPGQQAQQDKFSKGSAIKSDQSNKEKDGKHATSNPGAGKPDSKRL